MSEKSSQKKTEAPAKKKRQQARAPKSRQGKEPGTRTARDGEDDLSRPFFPMQITLKSLQAQKVYNRTFAVTSGAFTKLGVVLRIVGTEQQAREVEELVDEEMGKLMQDLQAEKERMKRLIEDNGLVGAPEFTKPVTAQVKIFSPRSSIYLNMIRELDEAIGKMTMLWLSGVLGDGQYNQGVYSWQRRLIRLAGKINNFAERGMRAASRESRQSQKKGSEPRKEKAAKQEKAGQPKQQSDEPKQADGEKPEQSEEANVAAV